MVHRENRSPSLLHLAMLTSLVTAALSHSSEDPDPTVGNIIDRNRPGIPFCNDKHEERTTGRKGCCVEEAKHLFSQAWNNYRMFINPSPQPPNELIISFDTVCSLLYVTTLDGRLSALDIKNNGKLAWSIQTGPGGLISSSIHRLELTNNGQFVRMIPSLSGGIYKFDGESIDPIPITAENLLSSSAKFSDDLVISGGKETRTYGVSAGTGELLYECSMNGCINATNSQPETAPSDDLERDSDSGNETAYMRKHDLLDDIIVVRRHTQTVRAVETRTGIERWNFSVGQHELNLVKSEECHDHPYTDLDMAIFDLDVKVVVPEGIVCAYNKEEPRVMLWKHKFQHPIVSIWKIGPSDELESIDMFGSGQWLWDHDEHIFDPPNPTINPSIYLGMYEKQLYIQESVVLRKEIDDQTNFYNHVSSLESQLPKIPWRPIPASSSSLIIFNQDSIISSSDHNGAMGVDASELKGNELMPYNEDNFAISAQSVLNASEYVNGNGFYLYAIKDSTETTIHENDVMCKPTKSTLAIEDGDAQQKQNSSNKTTAPFSDLNFDVDDADAPVKIVILSLWFWWREIAVIAFTTALVVNILIGQHRPTEPEIVVIERHIPVPTETATEAILYQNFNQSTEEMKESNGRALVQSSQRSLSESTTGSGEQYTSRFQGDFDLVRCLGRGGFGVVFEAKNKLDDCKYAVKRITLPNKKESRERVMREVKTLANCEHHNIVRYFQAWVETPPPGWQEEEDSKWLAHEMSTSIQIETPDGSSLPSSFGNGLLQSPKAKGKLQVEKKKQLLSWVSSVKSTSCSSYDNSLIKETDAEDDEDSLIVFRTESQSRELQEAQDTSKCVENVFEHASKTEAIAIDIQKSSSLDLHLPGGTPNGRLPNASQLSDSFKIEFVRCSSIDGSGESVDGDSLSPAETNGTTKKSSTSTSTTKVNPNRPANTKEPNNINENNNENNCKALLPMLSNKGQPQNKVYLYIQMQLCRKESLRDWLREHKMDTRQPHIASIFHQIVDAVDYVHLKGLIHRDLKPSNIFFSQDGQIKIGDFGLVTDMSDIPNMVTQCGDKSGLPSCQRHTQQVGTHLYMSPEQLRGEPYDFKVDIYSLGLIFFELLVHFSTEMERIVTLRNLREGRYPPKFPAEHSAEHELLQLMLAPKPELRPSTGELKQTLLTVLKLPELVGDGLDTDLVVRHLSMQRNRSISFNE